MDCKCKFCGYEWTSNVDNPKQCPECKRYKWKEVKNENTKNV